MIKHCQLEITNCTGQIINEPENGPSSYRQKRHLFRGPNYQPISDHMIDGPSSYRPKWTLYQNQREVNGLLSIWTRTIFEFIYAWTCKVKICFWLMAIKSVICFILNKDSYLYSNHWSICPWSDYSRWLSLNVIFKINFKIMFHEL